MLILQCILYLHTQSCIDLTNSFNKVHIKKVVQIFNEVFRGVNISGFQCDFFSIEENIYFQSEAAQIWYENMRNGLLDHVILEINLDS